MLSTPYGLKCVVRNILLTLAYDGTDFAGWQVQAGSCRTVQGALEAAIARVTGQTVRVAGASRTDAGVHAEGQVASARIETALAAAELQSALNGTLPSDAAACGDCHFRGVVEEVDASGGLIKHHEQYEELFQSKHVTIDCVTCHDPHVGVIQLRNTGAPNTTRTQCENCHFKESQNFKIEFHTTECIECHMPRVTKSALGDPEKFTGDIRTHLMAIDPNQIEQFNEEGTVALSQLGLNFACRHCHIEDGEASPKTDEELMEAANGIHQQPVETEEEAP